MAGRTQFFYFHGKTKWHRHTQPNQWNKWSMVLYPNPESLEKIRELQAEGLKNVIKKDEDGYCVAFSRPASKSYMTKEGLNQVKGFAPPEVLESDGKTPMRNVNVGNGSDVTVKVEVYPYTIPGGGGLKGKAARWMSTRVDNLVPFDGKDDFDPETEKLVRGQADQPEQLF